jgi:hypothetical protein
MDIVEDNHAKRKKDEDQRVFLSLFLKSTRPEITKESKCNFFLFPSNFIILIIIAVIIIMY